MSDKKVNTRSVPKLPYHEAASLLYSMGVRKIKDLQALNKNAERPPEIPQRPGEYYSEYSGWKQFIEDGRRYFEEHGMPANEVPSYTQLKGTIRKLGIRTQTEFKSALKAGMFGQHVPSNIEVFYGEEFEGWDTLLCSHSNFMPFEEAREMARTFGLKTSYEWVKFSREGNRPNNIPAWPQRVYEGEFISWDDFLIDPRDKEYLDK
ncbi:hypothetical protein [Alteromonas gilva]|uniref:Uncharacterized protein n=1 Tax=Alteromonas gilva TaxID=2987522 RepID=A0ABT5L9T8_9ALTE|nr:hypothetical protein [Alteromonas gilva]MDC8832868.1 hypothetical protein [Alteromonas gilva]